MSFLSFWVIFHFHDYGKKGTSICYNKNPDSVASTFHHPSKCHPTGAQGRPVARHSCHCLRLQPLPQVRHLADRPLSVVIRAVGEKKVHWYDWIIARRLVGNRKWLCILVPLAFWAFLHGIFSWTCRMAGGVAASTPQWKVEANSKHLRKNRPSTFGVAWSLGCLKYVF